MHLWSMPRQKGKLRLCLIHSMDIAKCMMLHPFQCQLSVPEASYSSVTLESMMRTSIFHLILPTVLALHGAGSTFFVVVQRSQVHNIAGSPEVTGQILIPFPSDSNSSIGLPSTFTRSVNKLTLSINNY